MTNDRTPTFRRLEPAGVETRVAALFYNLGKWIGDADESAVTGEYEDMSMARANQRWIGGRAVASARVARSEA